MTTPKRHTNAITAQSGASNPRPIAQALVDAIGECYVEGVAPNKDPAVFLILHQLAFVLTGHDFVGTTAMINRYEDAVAAVNEQAKED